MTLKPPKRHHLDMRAADIADAIDGDENDLLDTVQTAAWLGVSVQFLTIGRHRGYGPAFIRLSPRRTRYKKSAVLEWLRSRTHSSTAEYMRRPSGEGEAA
jgi:hypothetical protein